MIAMSPKISVLIPTFNRSVYLRDCIDSVLNQSFKDIEIIVVDDGSTDCTKDVLDDYRGRITYYYQVNSGISSARNLCVKKARGDFIAFIDSDDLWCEDKLERQYSFLMSNKDVDIVFCKYKNFLDGADLTLDSVQKELQFNCKTALVTALIKRGLFDRFGDFSCDLDTGEDSEWIMRIALNGIDTKHCLDYVGYYRRIHSSNSILEKKATNRDVLKSLAKSVRKIIKNS